MAASRAKVGPTPTTPPIVEPIAITTVEPVTLGTVKRDILLLSAQDSAALADWLTSHAEVQRDRFGNVLDPLPVRLRRVLHRLNKKDDRWAGDAGLWPASRDYDDGLRELEQIVTELSGSWSAARRRDGTPSAMALKPKRHDDPPSVMASSDAAPEISIFRY
jgi:hypothetical protein